MIVNKIQEVYAACKVFGHDVVRGILMLKPQKKNVKYCNVTVKFVHGSVWFS